MYYLLLNFHCNIHKCYCFFSAQHLPILIYIENVFIMCKWWNKTNKFQIINRCIQNISASLYKLLTLTALYYWLIIISNITKCIKIFIKRLQIQLKLFLLFTLWNNIGTEFSQTMCQSCLELLCCILMTEYFVIRF